MVHSQIVARGVSDRAVLDAMLAVPRHEFMPERVRLTAYGDHPLPIGHGQTISQPYIVAYMTERLELELGDSVLEVGSGSAYQAAVLAEVASDVCTIEIIPALAEHTDETLTRLGYDSVKRRQGDGYHGWPEEAPFNAIIVTAAASHVPPPLVEQLAPGGRLLVPVGDTPWSQNLVLVTKDDEGEIRTRTLLPVRFVPLTGGH
jgi:protein-L-isoaspartate(D-aspartate) O-methyltransferase